VLQGLDPEFKLQYQKKKKRKEKKENKYTSNSTKIHLGPSLIPFPRRNTIVKFLLFLPERV
jgi:hypothetical protein